MWFLFNCASECCLHVAALELVTPVSCYFDSIFLFKSLVHKPELKVDSELSRGRVICLSNYSHPSDFE